MKHKRLNRDGWGFQYYPYYQFRLDDQLFHGLVCLIRLTDGEANYWQMPKAGRVQVTGEGMCWLQLIPDGKSRVITVMYFTNGAHDSERLNYPASEQSEYRPSVWYVDIIDGIEYDEYGIAVFIDKYLDVIFTPEGDVKIDDRDELEHAYASGELNRAQYEAAISECESALSEYCTDIAATGRRCALIRKKAEDVIARGEKPKLCRETMELMRKDRGAKD